MLKFLRYAAFTMAEILLSLTIIGVVAAITLPSLTGNINERTWNTQRKALYSRLSQAVALMPSIRGYGQTVQASSDAYVNNNGAEAFLTTGLAKVLKINNICDVDHLLDCGLPSDFKDFNASNLSTSSLKKLTAYYSWASVLGCGNDYRTESNAAAFETANGESLLIHYNPMCKAFNERNQYMNVMTNLCVNFLYDLNGKKGPNTLGKDVGFMSLFYPTDSVLVAPNPLSSDSTMADGLDAAKRACSQQEARLPNLEELMSIAFNRKIMGSQFRNTAYWSASKGTRWDGTIRPWRLTDAGGEIAPSDQNTASSRCVKRD